MITSKSIHLESLLIDDALDDGLARTYKDIDEETDLTRKKKRDERSEGQVTLTFSFQGQ